LSKIGKIGLLLWLVSLIFGLVSIYWGVTLEGEHKIYQLENGEIVQVFPTMQTLETIYPLRSLHFLTYGFFALGLVLIKRNKIIGGLRAISLRSIVSTIVDES